jgi:hypothetical protein
MADEQPLNSLGRFRKQPGRLVLEEHSHCEVPAGCGGVVLRWRNPFALVPLTVHVYAPVKVVCVFDGAPADVGRVDLAPGRHVAAFVLKDFEPSDLMDPRTCVLTFAASHDPGQCQRVLPSAVAEPAVKVLSRGDGTWKFSLNEPPADWLSLAFNDHGWPALVEVPTPKGTGGDLGDYQLNRCAGKGAACLGLLGPTKREGRAAWWQRLLAWAGPTSGAAAPGGIWVRKVFELAPPEERPAED